MKLSYTIPTLCAALLCTPAQTIDQSEAAGPQDLAATAMASTRGEPAADVTVQRDFGTFLFEGDPMSAGSIIGLGDYSGSESVITFDELGGEVPPVGPFSINDVTFSEASTGTGGPGWRLLNFDFGAPASPPILTDNAGISDIDVVFDTPQTRAGMYVGIGPATYQVLAFDSSNTLLVSGNVVVAETTDGAFIGFENPTGIKRLQVVEISGENGLVGGIDELHYEVDPCADCPCPEDIDRDGMVAFSDILRVLSAWGDCPDSNACDTPGVCGDFTQCGTGDPFNCFCWTTFDGDGVCYQNFPCEGTENCPDGNCPPGFVCVVQSCCEVNKCVPEIKCDEGARDWEPTGFGLTGAGGTVLPDGSIQYPDGNSQLRRATPGASFGALTDQPTRDDGPVETAAEGFVPDVSTTVVTPRVGRAGPSGTLFAVREKDDTLVSIDIASLGVTPIGPLGVIFEFGGLAYDTSTDTLYMIDGRGAESLYTVNTTTGAATLVGRHGIVDLFGLTYDPTTDTLYGSGESPRGFYRMNRVTGAAVLIGVPNANLDGLSYDCARDQVVGGHAGPGDLFDIDRNTGMETLLLDGDFFNNCGMAYDPVNDLFWMVDWSRNLYTFDPNNGYARTLERTLSGPFDGLAYLGGCGGGDPCDDCPCPEDIDRNGNVGFSDILRILSAWGPCDRVCDDCEDEFVDRCDDDDRCHDCETPDGRCVCVIGSACDKEFACPDGDCPPGFFCCVNTCCDFPICLPVCSDGAEGGDSQLRQAQPGELTSGGIAR